MWACDVLMDFEFDDPELLWTIILQILNHEISDKVFSNLAAGPLESLMAHHGPDFIERVENEAKNNPKFKNLLGGVWQNLMEEDIWRRLQKAADNKKW